MTHMGIECFLAICRYKTASAAARSLYITQPSLSARLKVLETEVGAQLFYRCKGSREMILTNAGNAFYQLAEQYEELIGKMKNLGSSPKNILRVSCFNSLGTYLLPMVYKLFLQTNPQISLRMQDMEIEPATQSILQGRTDLAFTTVHISDPQLRLFPVFSEPMVLICSAASQLQAPVVLSQLPPQEEIYVGWCQEFYLWHRKVLGSSQLQYYVSIMVQLRQLLEEEGCWAIVPISVAKGLAAECNIRQLETDIPLPRREVSCVVDSQKQLPALDAFLDCLYQVLAKHPEFEILLQR